MIINDKFQNLISVKGWYRGVISKQKAELWKHRFRRDKLSLEKKIEILEMFGIKIKL